MKQTQLRQGADALGVALQPEAVARLLQYLDLLAKWNRIYNLTAIHDRTRWVSHHLLDSLSVVPYLPSGAVVDVGSGAGFPGLPIAVACAEREVVLLDANNKKCAFLRQAIAELKIANAKVEVSRVESFHPPRGFEVVISRAFAELAEFIRAARHLCVPGGRLLAMKGVYPDEEIAQLPAAAVERALRLTVPALEAQRHLLFVDPAKLEGF